MFTNKRNQNQNQNQKQENGPPSSPWDDMIEQMAYNDLKSLYVGERRIRARAEELFREAREILEDLAIAFCPRRVNELQIADPNGMKKLTMTELGQMVKEGTKERIYRLRAQARRAATPREIRKLQIDREELEGNLIREQAKVEALRDQRNDLLDDIDTLMWETVRPLMEDNVKLHRGEDVPDLPVPVPGFSKTYREMGQYADANWVSKASSVSRSSVTERAEPSPSPEVEGADAVAETEQQDSETTSVSNSTSVERTGKPPWRTVKAPPAPPTPVVPIDLWPDWTQEWRDSQGNFERDCDLVMVAGGTGLAWRMDIAGQLAEWWGVTPKSGSVRRAFRRSADHGLIELLRPERETEWNPGYLVALTNHGRNAYRFLRGEDPAPSQLSELLKRHKTAEHVALNLRMGQILWQVGYDVEIFPDTVPLGDDRVYYPDLKAEIDGLTIYVECERAIDSKKSERLKSKLRLYRQVSQTIHFATPTEEGRKKLLSIIRGSSLGQNDSVYTTSLEYLGVEGCPDPIWISD